MTDRNVYGDTGCTIKASDNDNRPKFIILTRFTTGQTFFKIRTNSVPSDNKIIQTSKMNNLTDTVFYFAGGAANKVVNCDNVEQNVAFSLPTSEEDRSQSTTSTNLPETVEEATESSTETHQEPSPETDDSQSNPNTNLPETVEEFEKSSIETQLDSSPETDDSQSNPNTNLPETVEESAESSTETHLESSPETDDSQSNPSTNLTETVEESTEYFSETQKEPSSETNDTHLTTGQWIIVGALVGVVISLIGLGIWLWTRRRCCRANDQDQNNYHQIVFMY